MGAYYGPEWLRPYAQAFWYPKEWLYGSWSKGDQAAFDDLYNFNIGGWSPFRNEFDKILNEKNRSTYFNNTGLTYADIFDPRKAVGSVISSGGVSNFLRISDNVKRLYR